MTDKTKFECYGAESKPFGRTYGQWTVEWWKWAVSIPKFMNPVLDMTGEKWSLNQPSPEVIFLAGIFGDTQKRYAHRKIKIPSGRSILFPILNCEANSLEYPDLKNDNDLLNHVTNDVNSVVKHECIINSTRILPERVPSDPRIFQLQVPKDNVLGVDGEGTIQAAADGYWTFIKLLPMGSYNLYFEGSCEFGRLSAGATYQITVE